MITNASKSGNAGSSPRHRRWRDRLFPPLSVVVACLLAVVSWQVAARVREYNSNRYAGGLIVAGMMGSSSKPRGATGLTESGSENANPITNPRTESGSDNAGRVNSRGLPFLSFPEMPASSPEGAESVPALPIKQLTRATGYAEMVAYVWERVLYGVAGVLALAGILGMTLRWVRGPHLVAAVLLLLSTVATLVGMRLLMDAGGGAFHPLPSESYAIAGVGQSVYGWILLAAFLRKPR